MEWRGNEDTIEQTGPQGNESSDNESSDNESSDNESSENAKVFARSHVRNGQPKCTFFRVYAWMHCVIHGFLLFTAAVDEIAVDVRAHLF